MNVFTSTIAVAACCVGFYLGRAMELQRIMEGALTQQSDGHDGQH